MGDGLSRLFADIPGNPPLQRLMTTATTLSELVELAGMAGYPLSVRELQLWAFDPRLHADFWPWAGLAADQRLQFFREK
jgi:hypothetical protein